MATIAPPLTIAALRAELGLSLEAFGRLIDVNSKGRMSEIERGERAVTPEQALAIERLAGGRIDAAVLHPIVAAARRAIQSANDGAFAPGAAASFAPHPIVCDVCDERITPGAGFACPVAECPHAVRKAA